ncbi:hypothetical protein BDZ89DRAFT_1152632 [Hymenopellis radicata]|nr:hypothetical protein BDZ89DRAFT_1152632 [Hymenopellis radicata]
MEYSFTVNSLSGLGKLDIGLRLAQLLAVISVLLRSDVYVSEEERRAQVDLVIEALGEQLYDAERSGQLLALVPSGAILIEADRVVHQVFSGACNEYVHSEEPPVSCVDRLRNSAFVMTYLSLSELLPVRKDMHIQLPRLPVAVEAMIKAIQLHGGDYVLLHSLADYARRDPNERDLVVAFFDHHPGAEKRIVAQFVDMLRAMTESPCWDLFGKYEYEYEYELGLTNPVA